MLLPTLTTKLRILTDKCHKIAAIKIIFFNFNWTDLWHLSKTNYDTITLAKWYIKLTWTSRMLCINCSPLHTWSSDKNTKFELPLSGDDDHGRVALRANTLKHTMHLSVKVKWGKYNAVARQICCKVIQPLECASSNYVSKEIQINIQLWLQNT